MAFSVWRKGDGSFITVKHGADDPYVTEHGGTNTPPVAPSVDAVFLMAGGGIPELDTVDGWPHLNDCYETQFDGLTQLAICTGSDLDWFYENATASDPGQGQTSVLTGFLALSVGNLVYQPTYSLAALPAPPVMLASFSMAPINQVIPNHHSVTFDAKSTGSMVNTGGTTLTVSHTMSASANGYMAALERHNSSAGALSTVVWNTSESLTSRLTQAFNSNTRRVEYWDLVAPSSGAHNLVFTWAVAQNSCGGGISATGVDQATPRSNTGVNSGSIAGASVTCTSVSGELVLSNIGWTTFSVSDTVDATWTSDWNLTATAAQAVAHIAGASSVTRTDTLSGADNWGSLAVSLTASGAGAAAYPGPSSLGMVGIQ